MAGQAENPILLLSSPLVIKVETLPNRVACYGEVGRTSQHATRGDLETETEAVCHNCSLACPHGLRCATSDSARMETGQ
jgi:hypothetical protein